MCYVDVVVYIVGIIVHGVSGCCITTTGMIYVVFIGGVSNDLDDVGVVVGGVCVVTSNVLM